MRMCLFKEKRGECHNCDTGKILLSENIQLHFALLMLLLHNTAVTTIIGKKAKKKKKYFFSD